MRTLGKRRRELPCGRPTSSHKRKKEARKGQPRRRPSFGGGGGGLQIRDAEDSGADHQQTHDGVVRRDPADGEDLPVLSSPGSTSATKKRDKKDAPVPSSPGSASGTKKKRDKKDPPVVSPSGSGGGGLQMRDAEDSGAPGDLAAGKDPVVVSSPSGSSTKKKRTKPKKTKSKDHAQPSSPAGDGHGAVENSGALGDPATGKDPAVVSSGSATKKKKTKSKKDCTQPPACDGGGSGAGDDDDAIHVEHPTSSATPPSKASFPSKPEGSSKDSFGKKSRIREKRSPSTKKEESSSTTTLFKMAWGKKSKARVNKHQDVAGHLKNFLRINGTHLIEAMWTNDQLSLEISFCDLRKFNKEAAHKICNGYDKSMHAALCEAALEVVWESLQGKDLAGRFNNLDALYVALDNEFRLHFIRLPKRISSLQAEIENLSTNIWRTLFKNNNQRRRVVAEMCEEQRKLLVSSFDKLVIGHSQGLSWNGEWSIDDWECINGRLAEFTMEELALEDPEAHLASCKNDYKKFATEIVSMFSKLGIFPAYLQHFHNELEFEAQLMSFEDFFGWYRAFLAYHPALMSPTARLALIQGWYLCINDLGYETWAFFEETIGSSWSWTWAFRVPKAKVDLVAWLAFWHKHDQPSEEKDPSEWDLPYADTFAQNLKYLRQLCVHAYRYTKLPGGHPTINSTVEPEMFAAEECPDFLPEFIKLLLSEDKMKADFGAYWEQYKMQRGSSWAAEAVFGDM